MTPDEQSTVADLRARVAKYEQDAFDAAKARRTFNYQALVAILGSALTLLVARVPH